MEIQKAKINLVGVWALNLAFAKFRLLPYIVQISLSNAIMFACEADFGV